MKIASRNFGVGDVVFLCGYSIFDNKIAVIIELLGEETATIIYYKVIICGMTNNSKDGAYYIKDSIIKHRFYKNEEKK